MDFIPWKVEVEVEGKKATWKALNWESFLVVLTAAGFRESDLRSFGMTCPPDFCMRRACEYGNAAHARELRMLCSFSASDACPDGRATGAGHTHRRRPHTGAFHAHAPAAADGARADTDMGGSGNPSAAPPNPTLGRTRIPDLRVPW